MGVEVKTYFLYKRSKCQSLKRFDVAGRLTLVCLKCWWSHLKIGRFTLKCLKWKWKYELLKKKSMYTNCTILKIKKALSALHFCFSLFFFLQFKEIDIKNQNNIIHNNPRFIFSLMKVWEKKKNVVNSGHLVPWQGMQAARNNCKLYSLLYKYR